MPKVPTPTGFGTRNAKGEWRPPYAVHYAPLFRRITSYNVCYTKLLRNLKLLGAEGVDSSQAAPFE